MFRRIDHVEIVCADLEASMSFYTELLGFTVTKRVPVQKPPVDVTIREIAYLELGGTGLELISVEGAADAPHAEWHVGYRMMALEVDDMDEAVTFLESNGVELTWGPEELEDSVRAEIEDPNGVAIELREWRGA